MANYATLKAAVQAVVKSNGVQSITGANLQSTLISMIESLGANYTFAGVATPSTSPGTPDQNVFYIGGAGTYTNFGGSYTVNSGELCLFLYDGSWVKNTITIISIVDNLSSSDTGKALSANQGKVLDKKIADINERTDVLEIESIEQIPTVYSDLEFSDKNGNILARFRNGDVRTKNFNSSTVPYGDVTFSGDLSFSDKDGNILVIFSDGNIKTKFFDSSQIQNRVSGLLKVPEERIPIYLTCNDLDKSNRWGINSRNKSLGIYLDHFFHTSQEINVRFNNGGTYSVVSQDIVGASNKWNNNQTKYEQNVTLLAGDDSIDLKVRSILNSATSSISPIVLQIGDSVTEGWFANYQTIQGAPVESWSWAKYYFEKDKAQNGGGFNSLFVGSRTSNTVNYDGISYKCYAYGWGGKTSKWYCTGSDSPFNSGGSFSLTAYLSKYKTLADDGETRLVPGSTAGTEVTDATAWDLCTPNVVVVQLGMNDNLSDWKSYMPQIINNIKTEYPTMKIIISVLDACTCNFPSLYPNYKGIYFDNYNNDHTKLLDAYCYAIDNWQDEANGIYVIYSGMVMPMPYSCNVRETEGYFDGQGKCYIGVDSIERVPHPNRYAHQEIGYMLYSTIKWILTS